MNNSKKKGAIAGGIEKKEGSPTLTKRDLWGSPPLQRREGYMTKLFSIFQER
tara:strand:+ start:427 stop:582 length:156 start_codon:yes stop_codon:yes gene_type:complete